MTEFGSALDVVRARPARRVPDELAPSLVTEPALNLLPRNPS